MRGRRRWCRPAEDGALPPGLARWALAPPAIPPPPARQTRRTAVELPAMRPKELTFRGLLLGALITIAFTAANVYLGLRVGLTVASSIPAAVISMAVLSVFKDSSILENNIVQTVASAAGTLA